MKYIHLLSISFFVYASSYAQEQPKFAKKPFMSPTGDIYWHTSLPLHLEINAGDSLTDFPLTRFKSPDMAKKFSPLYLNRTGVHLIRYQGGMINNVVQDVAYVINVDGQAPLSVLTLKGDKSKTRNGKSYVGRNCSALIRSTDDMSGVEYILYSINGTSYATYTAEISFGEEKAYTVRYFAVDAVGNTENVKISEFIVDQTPPVSNLLISGQNVDEKIYNKDLVIKLESEDKGIGVEQMSYKVDEGRPTIYNSIGIGTEMLAEGSHTIKYFSSDMLANIEAEKKSSFYIDKTPPVTKCTFDGKIFKRNGKTYLATGGSFTITAVDQSAGVREIQFSENNGPFRSCPARIPVPATHGGYTLRFKSIDNVDNISKIMSANEYFGGPVIIDVTPPRASHFIKGSVYTIRDTIFVTSKSLVQLGAIDDDAGIQSLRYTIDNKTTEYKSPITNFEEGPHLVSYESTDNVGNSTSRSLAFIVDNSGPVITFHPLQEKMADQKVTAKESIPVFAAGTSIEIVGTDHVGVKSISYALDGKPAVPYANTLRIDNPGIHTLLVKSTDFLGNETVGMLMKFVIQ